MNGQIENIGARRLSTVMEKLLEEISFNAEDRGGNHDAHGSVFQNNVRCLIAADSVPSSR